MKKGIFSVLIALVVSFTFFSFRTDENGNDGFTTREYTIGELKAIYGDNIILDEGVELSELKTVTLIQSSNPCANSSSEVCGAAEAQARKYAQDLANECCCVVTFGWECCDPSTGTENSFLFITMPKNCN